MSEPFAIQSGTDVVPATASGAPSPSTARCSDLCLTRLAQTGDLLSHVLDYIPDSAFLLGRVSHGLNQAIAECVTISITTIFRECSTGNLILYSYISGLKTDYEASLELVPGNHPGPNQIRLNLAMSAHRSLVKEIRVLGTRVPSRILSSQEVARYSDEVQRNQDVSLSRAWPRLCQAIVAANGGLEGVPEENASMEDVRAWLRLPANRPRLEKITSLNLNQLSLTSVPREICLCTALQVLNLENNQLCSFEAGAFKGLVALQELKLGANTQLTSLRAGVFEGLPALQILQLNNNGMTSLGAGTFEGLGALKEINLMFNQLTSLEVGVFEGLVELQKIAFYGNRLTLASFENRAFEGLVALRSIHVGFNRMTVGERDTLKGLWAQRNVRIVG